MANNAENNNGGSDLAPLEQQRNTMLRNISVLHSKSEKDGDKVDSNILQCRLEILENYFKQICEVQGQIEKLSPTDDSRSDLEEVFILAKSKLMSLINKHRSSTTMEHSFFNSSMALGTNQSHLPKLKLPHFDGKYADYKRFITSFNNMVHENASITPVDKFNYLLDCLSGPALAVVEPFQVTDENYSKALKRLKERYDNKVLIFLEHITALFNISEMPKNDCVSLRNIIDTVAAIRCSLLSLGSEMDVMNAIIIHIVLSKLDEESKLKYDEKQQFESLPSWDICYNELSRRCQFLESFSKKSEPGLKSSSTKPNSNFHRSANTFVNSHANSTCSYCNSSEHHLAICSSFLSLIVSDRFNFVKRNGLCINCLRKGHLLSNCLSKSRCRVCNLAHHTTLHIFVQPNSQETGPVNAVPTQPSTTSHSTPVSLVARSLRKTIIPTAVVLIKDSFGSFQSVRVLLDSCSEINFITEETAKRLKLKFEPNSQNISGIADVQTRIKFSVAATIKSKVTSFQWSSNFLVTKTISPQQPGEYIDISDWKIPETIQFADPFFYEPHPIDLLISTEIFFDLLLDGRISLGSGMPCLVNTVFGWVVGGKYNTNSTPTTLTCNLAVVSSIENKENTIEAEKTSSGSKAFSEKQQKVEKHYVEKAHVDPEGPIQLKLHSKLNTDCLDVGSGEITSEIVRPINLVTLTQQSIDTLEIGENQTKSNLKPDRAQWVHQSIINIIHLALKIIRNRTDGGLFTTLQRISKYCILWLHQRLKWTKSKPNFNIKHQSIGSIGQVRKLDKLVPAPALYGA